MKPKQAAISITIIAIAIVIYYFFTNSSSFILSCPLYATTGIYCPGCGSQRALHDLLHLNIKGVFKQNLLFIAGLLLVVYQMIIVCVNSFYNKNLTSLLYHKKAPIVILIVAILFWVLRNIPTYPFTWLAPN